MQTNAFLLARRKGPCSICKEALKRDLHSYGANRECVDLYLSVL